MNLYRLIRQLSVYLCIMLAAITGPARAADHAVVLQYHHVDDQTPQSTSISPQLFRKHLDTLSENDYHVWSLRRIVNDLKAGRELPERCVALTFDDAYRSVFTVAYPLLKQRNWPFTVFVTTDGVDRGHASYMTWAQMREMQRSGAEFEGHSHTHPYMIRMKANETPAQWEERMWGEILQSNQRINDELGRVSTLFAYPYGEYNLALKRLVVSLGLTGVGQHSGVVWRGGDFGALPRFPMSGNYAEMAGFKRKIDTMPLPVSNEAPEDPQLAAGETRPTLRLTLEPGAYHADSLACYASGQGRIPVRWIDREKRIFECQAERPLPPGRSRYNCTARHTSENRYFWFSRQWIRRD